MTRFILLILILLSLLAGSCSGRKTKLDRSGLIPEKELVSILTDIYLADGLLTIPKIHSMFPSLDSLSTYYSIIEIHGYTKETMDKTMKYYFIKNPKALIRIYDRTLGTLSEMDSRFEKESILFQGHYNNLWKGPDFYCFPALTGSDSARFSVPISDPGIYSLSYTATFFPDDQSVNPRLTAYACHPDSIETGKRQFIKSMEYIKDGQPHIYTINFNLREKKSLLLRGLLYDLDNFPDEMEKHAIFENLILRYTYVPA